MNISLREANLNDRDLLYSWFNDKSSLKYKIKTTDIDQVCIANKNLHHMNLWNTNYMIYTKDIIL